MFRHRLTIKRDWLREKLQELWPHKCNLPRKLTSFHSRNKHKYYIVLFPISDISEHEQYGYSSRMSVYIGEEERENIEMDEGGNVVQKGGMWGMRNHDRDMR
ncbi:hypothetical protein Droror1_Dr00026596 [Drosera rotundifolia]